MILPIGRLQVSSPNQESTVTPAVAKVDKLSSTPKIKDELDEPIKQSSNAEISVKDNYLILLFNAVIENINEQLTSDLGTNVIKKSLDEGLEVSPESIAQRIVSLTALQYQVFTQYQQETDEVIVLDKYIEALSIGVDDGFREARSVLNGLEILNGDIASNVDKTHEFVQEKLMLFKNVMNEQRVLSD